MLPVMLLCLALGQIEPGQVTMLLDLNSAHPESAVATTTDILAGRDLLKGCMANDLEATKKDLEHQGKLILVDSCTVARLLQSQLLPFDGDQHVNIRQLRISEGPRQDQKVWVLDEFMIACDPTLSRLPDPTARLDLIKRVLKELKTTAKVESKTRPTKHHYAKTEPGVGWFPTLGWSPRLTLMDFYSRQEQVRAQKNASAIYKRVMAKDRVALAQKYALDVWTLDLLERAGRAKGW